MGRDDILTMPLPSTELRGATMLPDAVVSQWEQGAGLDDLVIETLQPKRFLAEGLIALGYGVYRRPNGRDFVALFRVKGVVVRAIDGLDKPRAHPIPNHGMPWGKCEVDALLSRYKVMSFIKLAEELGRQPDAVLFKLEKLRHVRRFYVDGAAYCAIFPEQFEPAEAGFTRAAVRSAAANLQQIPKSESPWIASESALQTQPQPQEPEMDKPNIETKTFIRGVDASTLSDDQIIGRILDLETQVEHLKKVKVTSTKVLDSIQSLEADIQALANYLDNR